MPVYRLTAGLTAARLRIAMREALDRAGDHYPEYLPASIRTDVDVVGIADALEAAHYPSTFEGRDGALRRLAYDELLALQLGMVGRRRQRGRDAAEPLEVDAAADSTLRASVLEAIRRKAGAEVELTPDQGTAMDTIRDDLRRPTPMLRLLQGDVGSGKTAVAAWVLGAAALAGRQGALLAPTDLLARQHHATLAASLEGAAVAVELLTGSQSAATAGHVRDLVKSGQAPVVVGTHALLQERVEFARLAVVVIDEQHRFGVEQRGQLEAKAGGQAPHVLLMTATPIPRTLGQVLYADLDVSDLRTPPAGRVPIRTGIRHPDQLAPSGSGCARRRPPGTGRSWSCRSSTRPTATLTARPVHRCSTDRRPPRRPRRYGSRSRSPRCASGSSMAGSSRSTATRSWRASAMGIWTCSWARPSSRSGSMCPRRR